MIKIENNSVSVELTGGTVWMTRCQIAASFGVFASAVGANIRAILKSEALREEEVCRHLDTPNGGFVEQYNLEMICALAFRLRSPKILVFRKWLMNHENRVMVMLNPPESGNVIVN